MKVLSTNPEVDVFTRYLKIWTRNLLDDFKKDSEIISLEGAQVTRGRVEGVLNKGADVVLLHGHGGDESIMGQNEQIIDRYNVAALYGKIVHAMSCSTAKVLGPLAMQNGTKGYIGYDMPFFAPTMNEKNIDPLKDDTAKLFLDPAFTAEKALLNGKKPDEAVKLAKNAFNRSIVKALTSDIQSDNDQFISLLKWDRDHLISC